MQVLPAPVHQAVQPDDPRAHPQEPGGDVLVRGVRQVLQTAGKYPLAKMQSVYLAVNPYVRHER